MKTAHRDATITGVLFILAAVSSIIALKLYNPLLISADFLTSGYQNENRIILGALFELILAASVVGTAIIFYPWLKKENEGLAIGYVCFRLMEAIIIVIGIVSLLTLLTLSLEYVKSTTADSAYFQTAGILLKAVHSRTFIMGPNFMLGINTLMCSYLLYKSLLVPRYISVMGLAGGTFIIYAALLEMFGIILQTSAWGITLAIPVFAYEMTLAFWLIFRGFNVPALKDRNVILQTR